MKSIMDDLLATLYVYRQTDRRGNCDIVRADDKNKAIINVNMALTALSRQLNIMSARQISKYSFNHDQCLRTAFGTLKQIRNKETAKHVQHIFHKTLQLDDLRTRVTEIFDVFVKGITLFSNDLPTQPIHAPAYHRPRSCGPRSAPDRKCDINNNPHDLKINKN